MVYTLMHFDTPLVVFSAERQVEANIKILAVHEENKNLFPLDLAELSESGIESWIRHRSIPKKRAYVDTLLSSLGLSINRPFDLIRVSKGLSLNDCYWLKQEDKFRCMPNYLDGQNDVKSYMRETMIDWLVDVNNRFRHRRETLYLCVNIVDRYVYYTIRDKSDSVSRSNYQLVGITAYLIASKYEEIYFPEIHQLLSFADYVFSDEDVKKMELKIVNTLKYDLTVPTTNKFLGRFLRVREV